MLFRSKSFYFNKLRKYFFNIIFLFSYKEMSATSTETDYTSSEFEEEEQTTEQETNPSKKIDLIKMAKIAKKKGITKKISDSDDETETEEQETTTEETKEITNEDYIKNVYDSEEEQEETKTEETKEITNEDYIKNVYDSEEEQEETKTNIFTCMNDEYKQKQTYKKITTGRENNEEILLCCSDVRQNLNNYFAIDSEEINERLNNNQILYEVIYGFRYIKPYIDLDMDDKFEDEEVYKTFKYILKTLQDKKLYFVFGGYTSIEKINKKSQEVEIKDIETTHKKLSLRIFAYKYAIDINKSLAFWVEYIGLNKELIEKKIIDPSVYKSADKQQKLRLLQSNKTTEDNKGVKNYYVYDVDAEIYKAIEEGFKVEYLAATWTKDAEIFDSSKLTDNETLKKQLRGKTTTTPTKENNKENNNENNKEEEQEDITPLFDENTLLKLLNLFPTDWEPIEKVISNLCHSPYPIDVVKRVCYNWYNSDEHKNGDKTANYIDRYYKYTKNNKWFFSIINQYYTPQTIKDLGWTEEDEQIYNKLAFKPNDKLGKKQRKQKEEIKDKYTELKEQLNESLEEEDKEKYKTRKYFIKLFRDIKRIITPYEKDGSLYNRLFVDEKRNSYLLNKRNRLEQLNKENFNAIIKDNKINEKRLTNIEDIEKYNYIRKYNDVFISNIYNDKVQESLNIFKSGFVNEYDYIYYMRWLSMKLNNPYTVLPRNIVCLLGTGSFKTTFIDSFGDFLKVSKINYSNDMTNNFNEWIDSSIVVIDEVPQNAKDVEKLQNDIKTMSGAKTVKINRKFEHEAMIENSANFIINSNYLNCGGLFSNQTQGEMFRRFRVIKKQIINQDNAEILFNNLNDKYILYNLFEYIKKEFKPMNIKEFKEVSEFEKEYMQSVKNTQDNKRVLSKDAIECCVDKYKHLRIKYLVDSLRARSYITSITNEKMALLQADVVKISGKHLTITDYDKFKSLYLNDEFEEEDDNDDEPEYAKIEC